MVWLVQGASGRFVDRALDLKSKGSGFETRAGYLVVAWWGLTSPNQRYLKDAELAATTLLSEKTP